MSGERLMMRGFLQSRQYGSESAARIGNAQIHWHTVAELLEPLTGGQTIDASGQSYGFSPSSAFENPRTLNDEDRPDGKGYPEQATHEVDHANILPAQPLRRHTWATKTPRKLKNQRAA